MIRKSDCTIHKNYELIDTATISTLIRSNEIDLKEIKGSKGLIERLNAENAIALIDNYKDELFNDKELIKMLIKNDKFRKTICNFHNIDKIIDSIKDKNINVLYVFIDNGLKGTQYKDFVFSAFHSKELMRLFRRYFDRIDLDLKKKVLQTFPSSKNNEIIDLIQDLVFEYKDKSFNFSLKDYTLSCAILVPIAKKDKRNEKDNAIIKFFIRNADYKLDNFINYCELFMKDSEDENIFNTFKKMLKEA